MSRAIALMGLAGAFAIAVAGAARAQEVDNIEERLPQSDRPEAGDRDGAFPDALDADGRSELGGDTRLGSFVLTAVDISGATAISAKEFAPLYDRLLAQYVTVSDVTALAEAITAMYRKRGYFLSRAIIPAQNPASGVLKVEIVEGYLDAVTIEGDATPGVRKRLAELTKDRPLRISTLERKLALIGDLAGVKVSTSRIEPDPDNLARHLLVVRIEQDRFEANLYADNRGTEDAGPLQTYVSGSVNSLLTTGDKPTGGVFFTPADPAELVLGQISYATPIGGSGMTLRMAAMTSFFDAGGPRAATEAESRTKRLNVSVAYPVIRRRRLTLVASAGFEGRNVEEERLGAVRFNDQLRSLSASATLRAAHLGGVTALSGGVTQGLDIFDASMQGALSRADATAEFTKFNADFARLQKIGANFSVYASVSGQYSLDPLLASEEFSLGGARYGRAYDYGEFKGDDGVATSVELRYARQADIDFLKSYQVYGYYDFGAVWNDNVAAQFEMLNLSSAGAGLRLTFSNDLRVNAELVKPLDGEPVTQGDQSWRGFFNVSKSF